MTTTPSDEVRDRILSDKMDTAIKRIRRQQFVHTTGSPTERARCEQSIVNWRLRYSVARAELVQVRQRRGMAGERLETKERLWAAELGIE